MKPAFIVYYVALVAWLVASAVGTVWYFTRPSPQVVTTAVEVKEDVPCPTATLAPPPWELGSEGEAELTLPKPDARLARRITFWRRFWGETPAKVYLFMDSRRPSVIHATVDCRDLFRKYDNNKADKLCDKRLIPQKRKLKKRFYKERRRPSKKFRALFGGDKSLAKTAYRNILVVEGKKNALDEAMLRAAPHLRRVERVFEKSGAPAELSRLAFIESLFQPGAQSDAGAAGAYQFMRNTGKEWLRIDKDVDERLDLERSAHASAKYLMRLYKRFGSWPLAFTAYNTGPTRMKRLVKRHRTETLGKLADLRTERAFGFDGQNYYASFYAVVELTRNIAAAEIGGEHKEVTYEGGIALSEVARCHAISAKDIASANPALAEKVRLGRRPIPAGYRIRIPDKAVKVASQSPSDADRLGPARR